MCFTVIDRTLRRSNAPLARVSIRAIQSHYPVRGFYRERAGAPPALSGPGKRSRRSSFCVLSHTLDSATGSASIPPWLQRADSALLVLIHINISHSSDADNEVRFGQVTEALHAS